MSAASLANLTGLLNRMLRGDRDAGDQALDVLYPLIRRIGGIL